MVNVVKVSKGDTYDQLTIIKEIPTPEHDSSGRRWVRCRCTCGNKTDVRLSSIRSKNGVKSCGCAVAIGVSASNAKRVTHGMSGSKLEHVYYDMRYRCHRKRHPEYKNYGARGIRVCKEWRKDIGAFFAWALANGYEEGLEIDREDNNKGYSPDNCRWVTRQRNMWNTRVTRMVNYKGKRMALREAHALYANVAYNTVVSRLNGGWTLHRALTAPSSR